MQQAFATTYWEPYFEGTVTVAADSDFDIGLAGHNYMLDWSQDGDAAFRVSTVPLIRNQADQAQRPGEASLNPSGLWRRTAPSWHHGAGQSFYDRDEESDRFRYNTSKGLNPWDRFGLALLNATTSADTSSDTNLYLAPSGGRLYFSEGQVVKATGVGDETFAATTGTPAAACSSLASDGATCYAGFTASGIYKATGTVFSSYASGTVGMVRYAHGRLLAANANVLYNVTAAAALSGQILYTHPNTSWTWTDATEGPGYIFISGYAGDRSMIYRTRIRPDGTALDIPAVAAPLPDGELAHSVTGYLGFLAVGTSKGVRFAAPDGDGNLTLGALIPTGSSVLCAEGQDRFIWFGWTNYDATSTGLGRLDPTSFTSPFTPAYASDLMTTAQGAVQACATYANKRWFTVSAAGLFKESTSPLASGTISGGRITFALPDQKTAIYLTPRHDELGSGDSVALFLAVDGGTSSSVGSSDVDGTSEPASAFSLSGFRGNDFEWTATVTGTNLRSITLFADPSADRTDYIYVPILLKDRVSDNGLVDHDIDVDDERAFLSGLARSRRIVSYQEGTTSRRVIVDDAEWRPERKTRSGSAFQGMFLLKLKAVS